MKNFRKNLIVFIIIASFLFGGSPCIGQSISMDYQGRPGVWFPSEMAKAVLSDVKQLEIIRGQLSLYEEKLEIRLERIENLKLALNLSEKSEQLAIGALQDANERAEKAILELDVWYRSPVLWVGVGVVITVALEVAAVSVLNSIQ